MDYLAIPPAREVSGTATAPASKSATNRALVLAALSEAPIEIANPLQSEDTRALAACLAKMGASITPSEAGLLVGGPLGVSERTETALDAGESGTAARFLTALAASVPGRYRVTGSARLRERPMRELVSALRSAGARIESRGAEKYLPLRITGGALRPGRLAVDASRSSQFLSALLLAAAAPGADLELRASGAVVSSPYVGMTIEILRAFGHEVSEGEWLRVRRGARAIARYEVPGDFSSALPLLASAGVAGGRVTVRGLRWPSADPDAGAIPVLEEMGVSIEARGGGVSASFSCGFLRAATARAADFPDAVPTLAALAAFAPGTSRFEGVGHLRLKESDRIAALASLLSCSGVAATAEPEALLVSGPPRQPTGRLRRLPTFSDHRIAMAAALLSLRIPGLLIENPGSVAKSYPQFFRDLEGLVRR